MKIISLVLTLLISINLLAQNTENWNKTFKSELLSTYFTKEKLKVIVVYSGENQDELKLAYKSLSNSLKNIKNIKSVLSNKMLGNTTKLDDKSIIKRAGFLDLDYIIIMRIFKDEDKFSAVVSLYNKKGDLLTGIFSEKGTQIEMHSHAPQQEI